MHVIMIDGDVTFIGHHILPDGLSSLLADKECAIETNPSLRSLIEPLAFSATGTRNEL